MGILSNYPLVSSVMGIIIAQVLKYILSLLRGKRVALDILTSTGGMPSSHSAAVSALITALGLEYGFESPFVAIATTFGMIVLFDAMGVRRQSGHQGQLLSALEKQLEEKGLIQLSDLKNCDRRLITHYRGHTPMEILGGVLTGYFVALALLQVYL
ncbi:divergent PAP2 family protein [Atopobacter sp. AH10]|uniref:divergent PAP2 family protein n=1 Tax=Atopobacter sp. AH10 TaxID=2315861 RepID=UPI000EF1FCA1|nr:divergent PAP2 family protein [Atopobacter sp. AH10]RLK62776.1 divergent PAP2 family protein [Atopobacter sp. AH10]